MAGITLEQAQTQLAAYLAAETAALGGQSYRIGDRMLTRADLSEIRAGIDSWNARVVSLSASAAFAGGARSRTVIAR
jgi:hypothetical protein